MVTKKNGPGETRGFVVFAGVFEGCLKKRGGWTWFFDGENVVKCVVNVVFLHYLFEGRKIRHIFRLYFLPSAGCPAGLAPCAGGGHFVT
jgi:hypothetical protein